MRRWRAGVSKEAHEAATIAHEEFAALATVLAENKTKLEKSRKTKKLTKNESAMITALEQKLAEAKERIQKEVADVEDSVE